MNELEKKSIALPPRSRSHLFAATEHQNFFGMDDRLGPVAISFRREEKEGSSGAQYNCRIIFRTTEVCVSLSSLAAPVGLTRAEVSADLESGSRR